MGGLLRLGLLTNIAKNQGRFALQETLEVLEAAIASTTNRLNGFLDLDPIALPVPVEAFPLTAGEVYTGKEGGNVGDVIWRAVQETPSGTLACNGASYATATYPDLFAKIGYTYGGAGANFNVPDLRGRSPLGVGLGSGLTNRLIAQSGGVEAHSLVGGELAAHVHDMTHGHGVTDPGHYHDIDTMATVGAPSVAVTSETILAPPITQRRPTDTKTTGLTVNAFSGATGNAGSGSAHNTMHPFLVLAPYIRYRLGPDDVIQTLPVFWGPLGAQWQLDKLSAVPGAAASNVVAVTETGGLPQPVSRVSAQGGIQAGTTSDNRVVGVIRVPYNFSRWKTDAFRIRSKVTITGVAGSTNCTVLLKVSDPVNSGGYLSQTASRVISESGGTIADSGYQDLKLTAANLGVDWKPGYMFRFELSFAHPKTFSTLQIDLSLLEIFWR